MWNGAVLRRQLAKLPNGNRMLIYSDATAQAEATAERPCCAGAYRPLTGVSHSVSIGVPPPSLRMTVTRHITFSQRADALGPRSIVQGLAQAQH